MREVKTMHGGQIYQMFIDAGGTQELWVERVAPLLKKAGSGPLYKLSEATLADILAKAKP